MAKINHGASFNADTGLWTVISLDIGGLSDLADDDRFLQDPFNAGYMDGRDYIPLEPTLDVLPKGQRPQGIPADVAEQAERLAHELGDEVTVREAEPHPYYEFLIDYDDIFEQPPRYEFVDSNGDLIGTQEPGGEYVEASPKAETLNFKVDADGNVDTSEMTRNQRALFNEYKDTGVFQDIIAEATKASQDHGEAVNVSYAPATMDRDWGPGPIGILQEPARVSIAKDDGTHISHRDLPVSAAEEIRIKNMKDWEFPTPHTDSPGSDDLVFHINKDGYVTDTDGEILQPVPDEIEAYMDSKQWEALRQRAIGEGGIEVTISSHQPEANPNLMVHILPQTKVSIRALDDNGNAIGEPLEDPPQLSILDGPYGGYFDGPGTAILPHYWDDLDISTIVPNDKIDIDPDNFEIDTADWAGTINPADLSEHIGVIPAEFANATNVAETNGPDLVNEDVTLANLERLSGIETNNNLAANLESKFQPV